MNANINKFWKEFEENGTTHSTVHYIFAIYKLVESNGYARGVDIARELDISAGSCSV